MIASIHINRCQNLETRSASCLGNTRITQFVEKHVAAKRYYIFQDTRFRLKTLHKYMMIGPHAQ